MQNRILSTIATHSLNRKSFLRSTLAVTLASISIFSMQSCDEENELINLTPNGQIVVDSSFVLANVPTNVDRIVVIEEGTGVRCKNCPSAHDELYRIQSSHPNKVIAVAYHTDNFYARPLPGSKYDFRNEVGPQIWSLLGNPPSFPIGAVNRKVFVNNDPILIDYQQWSARVNSEVVDPAKFSITLVEKSMNANTREYFFNYRVVALEDINEPVNFTAILTEDNITDLQENNQHIDSQYVHGHVHRNFIGNYSGFTLANSFKKGQGFDLSFNTVLDPSWKEDDLNIVTFVHYNSASRRDVLQGHETSIK